MQTKVDAAFMNIVRNCIECSYIRHVFIYSYIRCVLVIGMERSYTRQKVELVEYK